MTLRLLVLAIALRVTPAISWQCGAVIEAAADLIGIANTLGGTSR